MNFQVQMVSGHALEIEADEFVQVSGGAIEFVLSGTVVAVLAGGQWASVSAAMPDSNQP